MTLIAAEGPLLDEILDSTFPVWHEGLSRAAYARLNLAQQRTPWGRRHLQRVALVDAQGRLLSSAKRYRHEARLGGRVGAVCGLGAVFTPPVLRGRGYASRLVEQVVAEEQHRGTLMAFLFSGIGPAFYERLGFAPVPLDEIALDVQRGRGAPAMLVRSGEDVDLPALAAMHDTRSAAAGFALRRPPDAIHFSIARKRLFAGLSEPGLRRVEFLVAEEGASAVAYIVLTANAYGWTLEEAGDRDPAGARLGAMLQALIAREPSHDAPVIRTWWPHTFPLPPQVTGSGRSLPRALFMGRALQDVALPSRADEVFYWHSDVF
jgi:GNAT superfamily N-acetyltransferase